MSETEWMEHEDVVVSFHQSTRSVNLAIAARGLRSCGVFLGLGEVDALIALLVHARVELLDDLDARPTTAAE